MQKVVTAIVCVGLLSLSGCASQKPHQHGKDRFGQVYYLDGAGGGSVLTNWGGGVKRGLKEAGYPGDFNTFVWNTGFGLLADQAASVAYKKKRGAALAAQIVEHIHDHPDAPVNLVALSAGTAVAAYALEALPKDQAVDNVVFLGSSLHDHFDLTEGLKRVRHRLFVFTSPNDIVLKIGAAITGTADRHFCGACSAGLHGFHLPHEANDDDRRQYSKVENIEWRPEFAKAGNRGGHTDGVNHKFVRQYVAPLLWPEGPRYVGAQPKKPDDEPAPHGHP